MAKLIPHVSPNAISLKPERDVATALVSQLPQNVRVYHSYCWLFPLRDETRGPLREGEADFVVVDPKRGLLVLEVKGGDIEYAPSRHRWYRVHSRGRANERSEPLNKSPFQQARTNLHALMGILKRAGIDKESFPGTYGYAVVFPNCEFHGEIPTDGDPRVLMTASDLPFLDRRIQKAFEAWSGRSGRGRTNTAAESRAVVAALDPVFKLVPALWKQIETDDERLLQLTDEQDEALQGVSEHPRVLVEGGAGTGKTLLAYNRAAQLVQAGQDVLFLCYNAKLAEWLDGRARESLADEAYRRLTITNFHKLCRSFYSRARMAFQVPSEPERQQQFWDVEVPNRLVNSLIDQVPEPRFDAIILDEAQDFAPDWWLALELLARQPFEGSLYVFYDPKQNVFDQLATFPDLPVRYHLRYNCRNTKSIANLCGRVLATEIFSKRHSPEGQNPFLLHTSHPDEQRQKCEEFLREWTRQGNLKPYQMAILSSHSQEESCLSGLNSLAGVPLVTELAPWKRGEGVLFSTIRTFKGLEADALIVLENLICFTGKWDSLGVVGRDSLRS